MCPGFVLQELRRLVPRYHRPPSASSPVTAHFARPVGNDSPGTDRQPSSSVSGRAWSQVLEVSLPDYDHTVGGRSQRSAAQS